MLRLIRRYLQAGTMDCGPVSPRTEGTPQGGPLSPLLSNILLDELDKELEQRGHRVVTVNREPKLRIAVQSVKRLRARLRPVFRRGRGRDLASALDELGPVLRGWVAYFRMAEVKASFIELDAWVQLEKLGVGADLAAAGAYGGRGPWHNSNGHHMKVAVPNEALRSIGLVSLLEGYQRLARTT